MKISKLALLLGALAFCATPASAQKLTFTLNWVAGGDHAPYFYAQKMGWYKDAGINIDFEMVDPNDGNDLFQSRWEYDHVGPVLLVHPR